MTRWWGVALIWGRKNGPSGRDQAFEDAASRLGSAADFSVGRSLVLRTVTFHNHVLSPPLPVLGRVLEVTDLPEGITRTEADKLFTQLAMSGAKIQWLKDAQGLPGGGGGDNGTAENGRHADLAALYTIVAVFPSPLAAQNASLRLNNSVSRFKLRVAKKNYDLRILERASSQ